MGIAVIISWMVPDSWYILSVYHEVGRVVLPDDHLDRGWFLDIIYVAIEGAVGGSENVAACYDGTAAVGFHLSRGHQTNLE